MKKIILIAFLGLGMFSCTTKWEYKIVSKQGSLRRASEALFKDRSFNISSDSFTELGMEGWELVDIYETIETVHPNFGNDRYITGIQPNVRTSQVNFVFKRKK